MVFKEHFQQRFVGRRLKGESDPYSSFQLSIFGTPRHDLRISPGLLMGDPRISTHPVQPFCFLHLGFQGDADHARLSLDEIGFLDNWEAGIRFFHKNPGKF